MIFILQFWVTNRLRESRRRTYCTSRQEKAEFYDLNGLIQTLRLEHVRYIDIFLLFGQADSYKINVKVAFLLFFTFLCFIRTRVRDSACLLTFLYGLCQVPSVSEERKFMIDTSEPARGRVRLWRQVVITGQFEFMICSSTYF